MDHKPRVSRITEGIFNEVHKLRMDLPNATYEQIGKLVKCRGGLSSTTVGVISRAETYQDYLDFNRKKFAKAKEKDEQIDARMGSDGEFIPISKIAQDYKNEKIAELLLQIVEILKN